MWGTGFPRFSIRGDMDSSSTSRLCSWKMRFFQRYSWISSISAISRHCQKLRVADHLKLNQRNQVNCHINQHFSSWGIPICCLAPTIRFLIWLSKVWYVEYFTQTSSRGRSQHYGRRRIEFSDKKGFVLPTLSHAAPLMTVCEKTVVWHPHSLHEFLVCFCVLYLHALRF